MNGVPIPVSGRFYSNAVEYIVVPLALLLFPIKGFVITVILFVFLDTLTGMWKCLKKGKGVFSSRGLSEVIPKSILYATFILAFYFIDLYIISSTIWGQEYLITKVITMVLIGIEVKSIDENLEKIWGIGLFEGLSNLFRATRSVISRVKEVKEDVNNLKRS